jgi:putative ABC transport system permease protein
MLLNIITLTAKNIRSKKARTILTILGVAVSIAGFVALIGLSRNLEQTLNKTYKTRGTDLIAIEKGSVDILSSNIDQSQENALRQMVEVSDVGPLQIYFYALNLKDYILVYGWERNSYLFNELKIEGKPPAEAGEAIIGKMAAVRLKKNVGDTVKIRNRIFTVSAVFESKSLLEDGAVIIPLEALQEIKSAKGKVTAFHIKLDMPQSSRMDAAVYEKVLESAREKIAGRFPDLEVKNVQSYISSNTPLFMVFNFLWAVSIIAFGIVLMGITNTMTTSILERTREIGIAMAMGWRKSTVICMVLFESSLIGFIGGVFGIVLGEGLMYLLVLTPQLKGFMGMSYDFVFLAQAVAIASALGLCSGIYPAFKAIAVEPVEALRYE